MSSTTTRPHGIRRRWAKLFVQLLLLGVILVGMYPAGRYLWATGQYRAGREAMERRDFVAARRHLARCLAEWPSSGETHLMAARVARRDGDLPEALRLLREAERLGAERDLIELERSLLLAQSGQYRSVLNGLWALVQRNHPDSVLILEALTPSLVQNLEVGAARECLDVWIDRDPANARPRLLKASILERMQADGEALDLYLEAARLEPDRVDVRLSCARLLLALKRLEDAREQYEWLAKQRPEDPAVQRGLAECKLHFGDEESARRILDELLTAHPDDGEAWAALGRLELQAGRPLEAEPHLRRAAARMPHDSDVSHNLALALEQNGKPDEAARARARADRIRRDQREVVKLMDAATSNSRDPEPRRQIALRMLRHGLESEAKRWLESALSIDPRHGPTHETLADYHELFGDTARAAEHRRIARREPAPSPPN